MATPSILYGGVPIAPGQATADAARKIRFGNATEDYAVFNTATQRYESAKSGTPWTGEIRGTSGGYASGGKLSTAPAATTPTLPQFTVTQTQKQPGIATATGNLLQQQQAGAAQTASTFENFLNEARQVAAQGKQQLATDQAAFDTSKLETQLPAINRTYETNQNNITGDMAARNKAYADETAATLARLNAENARYESAARGVADKAIANATARTNLYQLTSGTPTSGSGNLTNRYIRAAADIETPLQRELSARRYNQITDIERPYARELYGQDQSLLGRRSALESDYAGRQESTARYLSDLKMRVAGMSRAMAQDYLRSLGLPIEIQQRIIAGDIANLSGIQALDERANFYTVNTPFDESRLPQITTPSYSMPSRSYSGGGDPMLPQVPRAVSYSPDPAVAGAPSSGTGAIDPRTGQYIPNALSQASARYPVSTPTPNPYYGNIWDPTNPANYAPQPGGYNWNA